MTEEEKEVSEDSPEMQKFLKEVNEQLYDIFSHPENHKELLDSLDIKLTQEMCQEQIEAYHAKFGIPDVHKKE